MERDPRDLLQEAVADIDTHPDLDKIELRARRRRTGQVLAIVAAVAVGAAGFIGVTLGLAGATDSGLPVIGEVAPGEPAPPEPVESPEESDDEGTTDEVPPPTEASQTASDARRDGVLEEVAALPFDVRVNPDLVAAVPGADVRIPAAEGVWVVSRPNWALLDLMPPLLGDPSGLYGRDFIDLIGYGEVLLLDADESKIVRAYPFQDLAPQALAITGQAVYCTRQGDGGIPDSMLCRVDRETLEATVRVFPWDDGSVFLNPAEIHVPSHWIVDAPLDEPLFGDLQVDDGVLLSLGNQQTTRVDPQTLELLPEETIPGEDVVPEEEVDPDEATAEDERLIADLLRLADDHREQNLAQMPFGDEVALGLGDQLHASRSLPELVDPDGWSIDVADFRGYAGPFSALDVARDAGATVVSVGDYDRCVAPPTSAPEEVAALRRVSVQPVLGAQESCLRWWSVDLFLDEGRIVAVTLDLYGP